MGAFVRQCFPNPSPTTGTPSLYVTLTANRHHELGATPKLHILNEVGRPVFLSRVFTRSFFLEINASIAQKICIDMPGAKIHMRVGLRMRRRSLQYGVRRLQSGA